MIVDVHTHLLRPDWCVNQPRLAGCDCFDAAALFTKSAAFGAEKIIIQGWPFVDADLCRAQNQLVQQAMETMAQQVGGFCVVCPAMGVSALAEVERCLDAGFVGVGQLDPSGQGFSLDDPWFSQLCDLCETRHVPISFYTSLSVGEPIPGQSTILPADWLRWIEGRHDLQIWLSHYGAGLPFYALMPEVEKHLANVWFDTAPDGVTLAPQAFEGATQCLGGSDHLLWGTNFPCAQSPEPARPLPTQWEDLMV